MYYLRKISRGRWPSEDSIVQATLRDIEADTVVSEFKTEKNKLSVWKVEDEDDIKDAFIALGSNCAYLGSITAAIISDTDLDGITFDNEEGDTPTFGINQKHRNIKDLNYVSLGIVISSILASFRADNHIVKKSKAEMRILLAEAYKNDKLQQDYLSPELIKEISKEVARAT